MLNSLWTRIAAASAFALAAHGAEAQISAEPDYGVPREATQAESDQYCKESEQLSAQIIGWNKNPADPRFTVILCSQLSDDFDFVSEGRNCKAMADLFDRTLERPNSLEGEIGRLLDPLLMYHQHCGLV